MEERGRAGGRAVAWPTAAIARARQVAHAPWWLRLSALAGTDTLRRWAAVEVAPGRLIPWLPVAFGFGVVLYFTAEREPALWASCGLAVFTATVALLVRARSLAFPLALAVAAACTGFATATLRSAYVAHPVLQHPAFGVEITGWIEVREERERTDRIVLGIHHIAARRLEVPLERVRLSVRKGTAPPVGTFVAVKARLTPPLEPLRPGGYDFARDFYFQRFGATGFISGAIKRAEPPGAPRPWLRYATFFGSIRDAIDARIRAAVPGDVGSIASALITGKRDAISAPVNDAMYVSSLAHVLSISGYHMAVVAGVVFFVVRGLLALSAGLALRRPIKKWAAAAALIAAAFYLLLSGSEVATQRSFLMTAVVLVAVMVDRAALTMRNLALAAVVVLLLAPESVVHPSFQMSFAATLALIAGYERGISWTTGGAHTSFGARVTLWGGREVVFLTLASLVAGAATTLYAAYHFHRLAPYGVVANLLAMPIVSAWVMPAGLLALLALPFGFDAPLWQLMGIGIEWMITVALWTASLPGAVGRMAGFGTGPLLLATSGLLLLCLLRSPLRWCGVAVMSLGIVCAVRTGQPDVLVGTRAEAVALRGADGRLSMLKLGTDSFGIRDWLAADGDARTPGDPGLQQGMRCDETGCIGRLHGGSVVSVVRLPDAFDEDCRRAEIVISRRQAPPDCPAKVVIDRTVWAKTGAIALYRRDGAWSLQAARPEGNDRPWARGYGAEVSAASSPAAATAPTTRDATPREEDLQPDD